MEKNTNAVTRMVGRSKYAVDVMWRLWDSHNSCWASVNSRSIWTSQMAVRRVRDNLISKGRDPATITVERVFVEVQ